jgi:peptidoglycan-associated lipoprotein
MVRYPTIDQLIDRILASSIFYHEERKMKFIKVTPLALAVVLLFNTGCGKTVMENQAATDDNFQPVVQTEPVLAEAVPAQEAQVQLPQPEGSALFSEDLIFFDFDSEMLTPEAQSILQAKAQWLKNNPDVVALLIEGHCDSRGTDAYNMALGERRAEAVRNYLIDMGVDVRMLETQSYGEEKPAVEGNNEEAWARNRRASFLIK